jgi:hypothetical protein
VGGTSAPGEAGSGTRGGEDLGNACGASSRPHDLVLRIALGGCDGLVGPAGRGAASMGARDRGRNRGEIWKDFEAAAPLSTCSWLLFLDGGGHPLAGGA